LELARREANGLFRRQKSEMVHSSDDDDSDASEASVIQLGEDPRAPDATDAAAVSPQTVGLKYG
jgi:hypothetical protein